MRYSYNLRGTNGSGKTTVARSLISHTGAEPIEWARPNKPLVYEGRLFDHPIFFLGSYVTDCGGCDTIDSVSKVAELLQQYMEPFGEGVVFFEGLMISHMLGTVGAMQRKLGQERNVLAFLDTPLHTCIERVKARRVKKGNLSHFDPKNVVADHPRVFSCRQNAIGQGYVVVDVDYEKAFKTVLEDLTILVKTPAMFPVGRRFL
jgi:gluconate kinase